MATYSRKLTERSLEIAWSQWTELGVAGVSRHSHDAALDPEALLLFTAALGDEDARLRDESMDWCSRYGQRFVSVSRLRNLLASADVAVSRQFGAYAARVNAVSSTRWPSGRRHADVEPTKLSGKSRLPVLDKNPALLRLQLRAVFGVTARSEILLALLADRREAFHSAADLAYVGYTKRNIANMLDDLETGGLLSSRRFGNQVRYRLRRRPHLAKLFPSSTSFSHVRWDAAFTVLLAMRNLAIRIEAKTPAVRGVEARKLLDKLESQLHAIDLEEPPSDDLGSYYETVAEWILSQIGA